MYICKSAYQKIFFLFLNQNICCGYFYVFEILEHLPYSKELFNETVLLSIQNTCYNVKLMGKKIIQFYAQKFCLSKPMVGTLNIWFKLFAKTLNSSHQLTSCLYYKVYNYVDRLKTINIK